MCSNYICNLKKWGKVVKSGKSGKSGKKWEKWEKVGKSGFMWLKVVTNT